MITTISMMAAAILLVFIILALCLGTSRKNLARMLITFFVFIVLALLDLLLRWSV